MDVELIDTLVGFGIFGVGAFFILRSTGLKDVNSKDKKRDDIIDGYRKELYDSLTPLKSDKNARLAKKKELLKRFSDELSRNIFFEQVEIREIILDLADDY